MVTQIVWYTVPVVDHLRTSCVGTSRILDIRSIMCRLHTYSPLIPPTREASGALID